MKLQATFVVLWVSAWAVCASADVVRPPSADSPGPRVISEAVQPVSMEPVGVAEQLPASEARGETRSVKDIGLDLGLSGCDSPTLPVTGVPVTWPAPGHGRSSSKMNLTPASPSGLAITLSGLLTLAGWPLARSIKNAHLCPLPDWYHASGPAQIGHAVAFDLELTLPPVCFEKPVLGAPLIHNAWQAIDACRATSQAFVIPDAPRGPPSLS